MATETDKPKKTSLLHKTAVAVVALATGLAVHVKYTVTTSRAMIWLAAVIDPDHEAKILRNQESIRQHAEELEKILPPETFAKLKAMADTNVNNLSSLNAFILKQMEPNLAKMRADLQDGKTVLGAAYEKATKQSTAGEILDKITASSKARRRFKDLVREREKGLETYNNTAATVTDGELNQAFDHFVAASTESALKLEKEFAGLIAKEIPLTKRITMQGMHLMPSQKVTSGLVFATVAAISGLVVDKAIGWFGRDKGQTLEP